MTGALPAAITAVLAVIVIGGAVAAVGAREHRVAILGLLVAMAGSSFIVEPMADARGIAARIAGAAFVTYLLLSAARDEGEPSDAVALSWPVAALVAATAAVAAAAAGVSLDGSLPSGVGPATSAPSSGVPGAGGPGGSSLGGLAGGVFVPAASAGVALIVLSAVPILMAGEPLRLTVGLLVAAAGASLVLASVAGPSSPLWDLCLAVLWAAVAGAGWLLHRLARRHEPPPAR